jgi:hypothetical protein
MLLRRALVAFVQSSLKKKTRTVILLCFYRRHVFFFDFFRLCPSLVMSDTF